MQRLTRQRNAVFSAFSDAGRVLTAPQILAHAREIVPEISLSTVYRQVSLLLADGEIAKVELPGEPARYEVACKPAAHGQPGHGDSHADHHHHYFHCSSCGQVYLLHSCPGPMDDLAPKGFQVKSHEVTLHGICASCAGAETAGKGRAGKSH
ncbi:MULTISPECIES: Fur family transcriptional regulator [Variovorax]|uniref:Fur family transcriptional regulator n=1 Tax=Variovorax atrisoli TaxID=3394203 RepID=UPI000F7D6A79|nr:MULTISPECIES: transcriptional repressor [Variovorax]MBB3639352.1 Fur family ferric uptake transcriptional regulator [Variovorax sp. BK613]MDR6521865.1 Fur family ferric uptake transcriptional regulator [Variovorax paradoxus]RTD84454.1 transcriptional repressor [Variovorax sp. 369]